MDSIKKNYGKFTLVLATLVLLALAGLLLAQIAGIRRLFEEYRNVPARNDTIPPLPVDQIGTTLKALDTPPQWKEHKAPLFVSKPFLLVDGQPLAVQGGKNIHEPIPNEWVILQGLDISQVDLRTQDPDGDKFTNEEEFLASTDPNNPQSKPPYHTLLKLVRVQRESNRVVWTSYTGTRYAFNTVDKQNPTQFLSVNDTIRGTKFRIVKFTPKKVKVGASQYDKDVSELEIEEPESGIKVTLVLDTMTNLGEEQVWLDYRFNGQRMVLKKKQSVTLPPENTTFQVVDIQQRSVVLHNAAAKEDVTLTISEEKPR